MVAAIDADVDLDRLLAADALEPALLEHAQELGLQAERQLADLVEEQRAAVGHLEAAGLLFGRAGERALLVAEQLALDQRLGERGAVDGDARTLRAARRAVDRARDHLLAGAGLAAEQDRRVARADALDELDARARPRRSAR